MTAPASGPRQSPRCPYQMLPRGTRTMTGTSRISSTNHRSRLDSKRIRRRFCPMTALDISTKYPPVRNYIGGAFVDGNGHQYLDVTNPSDGSVISRVPLSPASEVDRAVQAAKKAFPGWAGIPIKERVQVFFRYKTLLEKNIDELAALVTEENGKVDSEARAEVLKSAELTEFA